MTSSLLVITFPDRERADNVHHALRAMRRQEPYNLNETLVVSRLPTGEIETRRIWANPEEGQARVLMSLARLIVDQASSDNSMDDETGEELQKAGLDRHFVSAVASTFAGEFSALFFLIPFDTKGDATELANVLSLFRGEIARTTLVPQARAYLEARNP